MKILIEQPCASTNTGSRQNNEDALFPLPGKATGSAALFLVCDGVGGAEKGEVASSLACHTIASYFKNYLEGKEVTGAFVQDAVVYAEQCFDDYTALHPETAGMATTLALLHIGKRCITVAHAGDSRVYQFRAGRVVFQTEDHSLVNSWLKLGKTTSEEAATHPSRHVILRAIQGTAQPVEAEVASLRDVRTGDFFFLCTDGVLEQCPTDVLTSIFSSAASPDDAGRQIQARCSGKTHDNFSYYILQVRKAGGFFHKMACLFK